MPLDVDRVSDILVVPADQRAWTRRSRHKKAVATSSTTLNKNFCSPSALQKSGEDVINQKDEHCTSNAGAYDENSKGSGGENKLTDGSSQRALASGASASKCTSTVSNTTGCKEPTFIRRGFRMDVCQVRWEIYIYIYMHKRWKAAAAALRATRVHQATGENYHSIKLKLRILKCASVVK